jgi:hypothetical protein
MNKDSTEFLTALCMVTVLTQISSKGIEKGGFWVAGQSLRWKGIWDSRDTFVQWEP